MPRVRRADRIARRYERAFYRHNASANVDAEGRATSVVSEKDHIEPLSVGGGISPHRQSELMTAGLTDEAELYGRKGLRFRGNGEPRQYRRPCPRVSLLARRVN